MPKYLQIQIPKTCEESWDNMEQQQHGKFCNSCQNTVIDFTRMTDDQLIQFFKKRKDHVCGRFTSDQLNTDIRIPAKGIPWVRYFFQITIPAFLFSSKTIAQEKVILRQQSQVTQTFAKKAQKSLSSKKTKKVPGIKCEESELADKILMKSESSQIKTDEFLSSEFESQTLMGIVGGAIRMVYTRTIDTVKQSARQVDKTFSIFPNPITSSSRLNIKWSNPVTANQTVEIYNESGILLQTEILAVAKGSRQEGFNLKNLLPATYIIKVIDNKTHKFSSQEFIVE